MSDHDDQDPIDEITDFFTSGPDTIDAGTPDAPETGDDVIEIALIGNLPVRELVWPPQYTHRLSHDDGVTALVQFGDDTVTVRVFPGGEEHITNTLPDAFDDLDHAVRWLASSVRRLVVIPPHGTSHTEIVSLEEPLLIFTGADDPAILASYKLLAGTIAAADLMNAPKPRTSLVFFGSPPREAFAASERIERTAERYLGVSARWNDYSLQRVDAIDEHRHDIPVEEHGGLSDFVDRFRTVRSGLAGPDHRLPEVDDRFDSFLDEADDLIDDQPDDQLDDHLLDEIVAPEGGDLVIGTITSLDPPDSSPEPELEIETEVGNVQTTANEIMELEVDEDGLITTAQPSDAEGEETESTSFAAQLAALWPEEPVPTELDAPPGPTSPEPDPGGSAASTSASDRAGRLFAQLNLRPVGLSFPVDQRIEFGLDRTNRLHLVAHEEDLRLLQTSAVRIRSLESLITSGRTIASFDDDGLQLDLIVRDAAANSDLHGMGLNLYLVIDPESDAARLVPLNTEDTSRSR